MPSLSNAFELTMSTPLDLLMMSFLLEGAPAVGFSSPEESPSFGTTPLCGGPPSIMGLVSLPADGSGRAVPEPASGTAPADA